MTVAELIEDLKCQPQNALVIVMAGQNDSDMVVVDGSYLYEPRDKDMWGGHRWTGMVVICPGDYAA